MTSTLATLAAAACLLGEPARVGSVLDKPDPRSGSRVSMSAPSSSSRLARKSMPDLGAAATIDAQPGSCFGDSKYAQTP